MTANMILASVIFVGFLAHALPIVAAVWFVVLGLLLYYPLFPLS